MLQRVAHENVCRLHEYRHFEAFGIFALVLELLEGGSLEERLAERGGRLEQREMSRVIFDVVQVSVVTRMLPSVQSPCHFRVQSW
eukprot:SAG11_NODE_1700_length_4412_cov_3.622803_5_plen_85_part_00